MCTALHPEMIDYELNLNLYLLIYRTISVNARAIINVSQVVARKMIENNIKGSIVNISSQASKVSGRQFKPDIPICQH